MDGVYFAVTFGITTVVFLFIKKYFSILVSLLMSLSSFVLLSLFPFLIVNLGMWRSILIYSVVVIMIGIILAYKIHKEQDRDDLSASVAIGKVDVPIGDLSNNDNEDISMKRQYKIVVEKIKKHSFLIKLTKNHCASRDVRKECFL